MTASDVVRCALVALAAWVLWRKADHETTKISGLVWKLPTLSALYVAAYFIAGEFIAWQSPELRNYYGNGEQLNQLEVAALQFVRGLGWGLMALMLAQGLKGTTILRATLPPGINPENAKLKRMLADDMMPTSPELLPADRRADYINTRRPGTYAFFEWYEAVDLDAPEITAMIDALVRQGVHVDATLVVF